MEWLGIPAFQRDRRDGRSRPNSKASSGRTTHSIRVSSRRIDMTGLRQISICLKGIAILSLAALAGCGSPETKAQNYYEQGMALIAKNDDLNARVELLNAVKYKADKVEVWRALAGIDERTKAQSLFTDLRR